jgi:hypothetical protein
MIPRGETVARRSSNFRPAPRRPRASSLLLALIVGVVPTLVACQAKSPPPPAQQPAPPPAQPTPPAQPPPPVIGKIRALTGRVLTLTTIDHGDVTVTLGPDTHVVINRPGTLADVRAGAFIGTTAVEGADGKLRASEVHVFPEALRGTGEGHYPWGNAPATTMTNGNVSSMTNGSVASRTPGADATAGVSLNVTYKGGQTQVEVPPDVPVVVIAIAEESLLKPGTQVLTIGQPDAAGALAASLVAILPPPAAPPAAPPAPAK